MSETDLASLSNMPAKMPTATPTTTPTTTPTSTPTKTPAMVALPTEPKLPHERDESVGSTGGVPSAAVQQAYKDVKRGLQDTSRGAAAAAAYEQLKKD